MEPVSQAQHEEVLSSLDKLHDKLIAMEERLRFHYETEHKAFDSVVDFIRGASVAAKIIGALAGVVAILAAAWEWIRHNFHVTPKN